MSFLNFIHEHGLVSSVTGVVDLSPGEHRNVLAIMLFDFLPYGLVAK